MLDLVQIEPFAYKLRKSKMVNFLEKFGYSGIIDEKNAWNVN